MKTKYQIIFFAFVALFFSSCKSDFMVWEKDYENISDADVPLTDAEKILKYDFLKSYTDIKLGIGIGLTLYMASDTTYSQIVNRNFDDVTVGYNMKHGAMVDSKGNISFTKVDNLISKLNENGMTLFGHCLVWHSNQNATYLNSLIEPTVTYTNLLNNGTFESLGISGWSKYNGSTDALSLTTNSYEGSGAMQVVNLTDNTSNQWKTQIHSDFNATLTSGVTYTVSFYIKSDDAGSVRCSTTGTAHYQGDQTTSTSWTKITWTFASDGTESGLNFDLGKVAGTYYIDNVSVYDANVSTSVEKPDSEKTAIIENALETYITSMVSHFKDNVQAWDVVNEPMKSDGTVHDGTETISSSDEFYWEKYLGKDYAVTAFKLAREYGNGTSDKLFINDYGLESNLTKCQGLIDYVNYIESEGATVDGIGTQMHISISTDTTGIIDMFKLLATTGKLIRISELDVQVNTDSPGDTELEEQAEMYEFVINAFKTYIPEAQQYEITVWGVSDNATEHENWLPDDAPNLWDEDYARKKAYKGAADGLAGKDVSEDFTGIVYTK